jgi:hypothetical protein
MESQVGQGGPYQHVHGLEQLLHRPNEGGVPRRLLPSRLLIVPPFGAAAGVLGGGCFRLRAGAEVLPHDAAALPP